MTNQDKDLEKDDLELDIDEIEDEEIKKAIQTESARKKHFREKFLKESEANKAKEAKIKELEEALSKHNKVETPEKDVSAEKLTNIERELSKVKLQQKGYTEAEIEFLDKVGGEEALSNEFVKSAIDQMRAKRKSEEAEPDGTGRSGVFKKYSEAEVSRMSEKQLREMIEKGQI